MNKANVLGGLLHDIYLTANAVEMGLKLRLLDRFSSTQHAAQLLRLGHYRSVSLLDMYRSRAAAEVSHEDEDGDDLIEYFLCQFELLVLATENASSAVDAECPLRLRLSRCDMTAITENVLELFSPVASERSIQLQLDRTAPCFLDVDAQQVRRLLFNLVSNAIKYSHDPAPPDFHREVTVSVRRHGADGRVLLSVRSYGIGIDEEEIASGAIYAYGYRGRMAADRNRRGSGIGLAEVKRIADAHGATLTVASYPQRGGGYLTSVEVVFPYGRSA